METSTSDPVGPNATEPGWSRRVRFTTTGLSVLVCLALSVCYAGRFDACAAVTVFPVWAWLVPGLAVAALGFGRGGNRAAAAAIAGWLVFLLAFAEEPWSLLGSLTPSGFDPQTAEKRVEALRVVSLNCNVGDVRAAGEVARYRPDVVLLQESPGRGDVEALAKALFGAEAGVVDGVDASMIVRGRVAPADLTPVQRSYFVQARVRFASGSEVEILGARLIPAVFRFDLWSPECWREQARNRRARRSQLRAIADRIGSLPSDLPVILGGDFNAPQGDAVFRLLTPRLHDAFREGGRGWGDTITNGLPFLRIDQVWASGSFRAVGVVARTTRHSDHRVVVCDLTGRRPVELGNDDHPDRIPPVRREMTAGRE